MKWTGPSWFKPKPAQPQTLYQFVKFDDPTVLAQIQELIERHATFLYVGRTNHLPARVREHANTPDKWVWWRWTDLIWPVHLAPGTSVAGSDREETKLIHKRAPWFNREKNLRRFRWNKYRQAKAEYERLFYPKRRRPSLIVQVLALAIAGLIACGVAAALLASNGAILPTH